MMLKALRFLACASLIAVAGCASTSQPVMVRSASLLPFDDEPNGSAYGLYLAGRSALRAGANAEASDYFAQAAKASRRPEIEEQAFYAAVLAGDMRRATLTIPGGDGASPAAIRLGRLVTSVNALAAGKGGRALAALQGEPVGYPHRAAAALLKPWAAAAAGDWTLATAEPELKSDRLAYALGSLSRAQLLERSARYKQAEDTLKAMADQDMMGSIFIEAYGEFLERRGRKAEAAVLYQQALDKAPGDAALTRALARVAALRPPPPLPDNKTGAAQALLGAAAGAMLLKQPDMSLVYLRLAIHLAPGSDEAWLMLGDTLAGAGDEQGARAAYQHVGPGSPAFVDARSRIIATYQDAADPAEALTLARDTARQAPGDAMAQTMLADALRANKQYAESADILDTVINKAKGRVDWRLYYLRAIALDKAGRWPEAERDLKTGLRLNPQDPQLLNYLGYTWVNRGEHVDEALGMIQQAIASEPDSGAVADSLGWAYFKLGQYAKAVEQLERASQLEPSDAEINSHLGDAYWRAGRQVEAQFQWRKVLTTMSPEPSLKTELEAKLKAGLEAPETPAKVAER